ncbi:tRNA-dihydrouridine(16/17) synthase [NAD(P)(+)] [Malassezia yamatoensis]|uniref:tRNA-dihydrouridine(16/17) synthase [NAD(P)(+)] n=1 Tax=Malassezia yamatoensis TaxID=253288 RepID=A0AAJ5YTQ2_9BASI|nr:tRNA-dihydrouridine(16/17) synthase [NAD(P)(+)] [Malassezia yamatoensis]
MYTTSALEDLAVYEQLVKALQLGRAAPENRDRVTGQVAPQIVQLAGDDPDALVRTAKTLAPYADGIDLNLGCPQRRAKDNHYGGYLLSRKDWPLLETIGMLLVSHAVSSMSQAVSIPITVKIRLCDHAPDTPKLAVKLAASGAKIVTLHARHVAIHRRRANAAKLNFVADIRDALDLAGLHASQPGGHCYVLSNGNVRSWIDIVKNLEQTRADGVLVGEPLLDKPQLFAPSFGTTFTGLDAMHNYLSMCEKYPLESTMPRIHQHLQYMVGAGFPPSRETRIIHDTLRASPSVQSMLQYVESLQSVSPPSSMQFENSL